jgi:hypothetical protein
VTKVGEVEALCGTQYCNSTKIDDLWSHVDVANT